MPSPSMTGSSSVAAPAGAYPDDLEPALQQEFLALADIEARFETLLHRLDEWRGPQSLRERRLQQLETWRRQARGPHAQRLAAHHNRMMSLRLLREPRMVH